MTATDMPLLSRINAAPLWRPWGLPRSVRAACCIVCHEHLEFVPQFLAAYPGLDIPLILVPDLPEGAPRRLSLAGSRSREIPLRGVERLETTPQWPKIFLVPDPVLLSAVCRLMAIYGGGTVYLDGYREPPFGLRKPLPDFFARNAAKLEEACALLTDE